MKKIIVILYLSVVFVFYACKDTGRCQKKTSTAEYKNEYMLLAVLYQQTAAEVRALQYQVFNFAKNILDEKLKDYSGAKKPAIVVDIDETILDNSPYQAQSILNGFLYPVKWDEWCSLAVASAIPGSVDFLNYAHSKGVAIFYITNRKENLRDVTVANLKNEGFPNLGPPFLIFGTGEHSKENRREKVRKEYEIIMLFGDNLHDFSACWDKTGLNDRKKITDSLRKEFGINYFVLPNSMYGDWEGTVYSYDYPSDIKKKKQLLLQNLNGFY